MMRVLIGCECSGVVREAFRAKGHDAWSCDLKPAEDGSPYHWQEDVMIVARSCQWDLAIFHPDCTYLTVSGLHWNSRGRMVDVPGEGLVPRAEMTDRAEAFVRKLWVLPIKKVVIENPIGCLSTRWMKPTQIVQPWQFGDDASKATCLWIRGLPSLPIDAAKFCPPRITADGKRRWANQTDSGQNRLAPSATRAADRSRTYPGLANAFAETWGPADAYAQVAA